MDQAAAHSADLEDSADLENTVRQLAPRLLRFARGRYRGGTGALAEEAAQDALAALVDRWRRLGPPDSPEAFAFAVLRRRLARARVRHALSHPLEILTGAAARDERADPERRTEARSRLRKARDAVQDLPSRLRDALLLVAVGELDTRSAAAVLGISESALKMRVSRARAQLRERLEHDRGERDS